MIAFLKRQTWVTVAMFENAGDGQMLEAVLKGKGFEVRTFNDKLLQHFLFLCPPHATFRVQVRDNDFNSVTPMISGSGNRPRPLFCKKRSAVRPAVHCTSNIHR